MTTKKFILNLAALLVVSISITACAPKKVEPAAAKRGGYVRVFNDTDAEITPKYRHLEMGRNVKPGTLTKLQIAAAKGTPLTVEQGSLKSEMSLETGHLENVTVIVRKAGDSLELIPLRGEPRDVEDGKTHVVLVNLTNYDATLTIDNDSIIGTKDSISKPIITLPGIINAKVQVGDQSMDYRIETTDSVGHSVYVYEKNGNIHVLDSINTNVIPGPAAAGMSPAG